MSARPILIRQRTTVCGWWLQKCKLLSVLHFKQLIPYHNKCCKLLSHVWWLIWQTKKPHLQGTICWATTTISSSKASVLLVCLCLAVTMRCIALPCPAFWPLPSALCPHTYFAWLQEQWAGHPCKLELKRLHIRWNFLVPYQGSWCEERHGGSCKLAAKP